ncbi:hypothetical protein A1O3_07039 [Capronia epimyces CBS 606.96]|uniref:Cytochrome P450 n=1 Tax=Capronia epimyces CBS 606.96 TaxID=1182542 RepID=W9XTT5_9EURO|nr:uncharacterized protein A1O3_07039 [Capronia epimyces CBS 606.96]EXJ80755.1 hypothetical protein A1O3_07039 [Capronia epimyces CBS 606.96]
MFESLPTNSFCAGLVLAVLVFGLWLYGTSSDIPKIQGIPEMPSAMPFIGHLHLHAGASGVNDAALWSSWSRRCGSDLLQVKFGRNRVVVANSFNAVREVFVTNGHLTSARPRQYVFEKYIGYDLGSHSLDENYKQQRLAGLKALKPIEWPKFYPGLEKEGDRLIVNLAELGNYGKTPINPLKMMQIVAMNLGFQTTFGKTFDDANDPWLREYIDNAMIITTVRGASNTWSDFVPLLRLSPKFRRMAKAGEAASKKRSRMIGEVLQDLQTRLNNGERPDCIAASVLTDGDNKLTLPNAIKCCTSMLQGGTESLPSHICAGLGGLISPEGEKMQEKAYADILEHYPDGDAADHAFNEEKVPYLVALYKEILRNYVVLPFSLPHEASSDIHLKSGVVIPKGTRLYMNSEAANHDETFFGPTVDAFEPGRWLDPELNNTALNFFSYGIGPRVCPAWSIANRMMYGLLLRMILAFDMKMDPCDPPPTSWRTFGRTPSGVLNAPKMFNVRFVPRNEEKLRAEVEELKKKLVGSRPSGQC